MTSRSAGGAGRLGGFVAAADQALGRAHRPDPAIAGSGGPAGNARLTAWTGWVLLVLSLAELVTLLDVDSLIDWHVAIGAALLPPALVKTGSTGWRIVRYYRGTGPYRAAGPPPMPLRVLGPVVVAATLGLLGSGVLLVLLGPASSRTVLVSALGQRVDWVTLHQGLFIVWAVAVGLHVLARLVPAWQLTLGRAPTATRVDGGRARAATLLAMAAVAAALAVVLVFATSGWGGDHHRFDHRRPAGIATAAS